MKDQKIEVPPLPAELRDVEPEARAYAYVAVEADRQRRGEPVGYLVELDGRDTYVSADRTVRDAHLTYGWRPVYAAPQPAEPVKVPSDAELLDFYHARTKNEIRHSERTILPLFQDLLARYGQPAQPVVSDWPTINDAIAKRFPDDPANAARAQAAISEVLAVPPAASAEPVGPEYAR